MGPTIEWDPRMSKWVGPTHVQVGPMWDPPIVKVGSIGPTMGPTHCYVGSTLYLKGGTYTCLGNPRGDPLLKWDSLTRIYIVWWDHVLLEWRDLHIGGPMWDPY
jgi:hypothetical protein